MKIIMALLLLVGSAGAVQAQTSDQDIDRAIDKLMGEIIESELNEGLSCLFPSAAVFISEKGRAVEKYLQAKQAPDSPSKRSRVAAARDGAVRLGGLVAVSPPAGHECRLSFGKDYDLRR